VGLFEEEEEGINIASDGASGNRGAPEPPRATRSQPKSMRIFIFTDVFFLGFFFLSSKPDVKYC